MGGAESCLACDAKRGGVSDSSKPERKPLTTPIPSQISYVPCLGPRPLSFFYFISRKPDTERSESPPPLSLGLIPPRADQTPWLIPCRCQLQFCTEFVPRRLCTATERWFLNRSAISTGGSSISSVVFPAPSSASLCRTLPHSGWLSDDSQGDTLGPLYIRQLWSGTAPGLTKLLSPNRRRQK